MKCMPLDAILWRYSISVPSVFGPGFCFSYDFLPRSDSSSGKGLFFPGTMKFSSTLIHPFAISHSPYASIALQYFS